jgi:hypothetical protein
MNRILFSPPLLSFFSSSSSTSELLKGVENVCQREEGEEKQVSLSFFLIRQTCVSLFNKLSKLWITKEARQNRKKTLCVSLCV